MSNDNITYPKDPIAVLLLGELKRKHDIKPLTKDEVLHTVIGWLADLPERDVPRETFIGIAKLITGAAP